MPDAEKQFRHMEEEWERSPGVSRSEAIAGVGPGWHDLAEAGWRAITEAGGRVRQVKEKFGLLRIYWDGVLTDVEPNVRRQIDLLEHSSRLICEWCGEPGEYRGDEYMRGFKRRDALGHPWWIKTLCDLHAYAFYVEGERWWHR